MNFRTQNSQCIKALQSLPNSLFRRHYSSKKSSIRNITTLQNSSNDTATLGYKNLNYENLTGLELEKRRQELSDLTQQVQEQRRVLEQLNNTVNTTSTSTNTNIAASPENMSLLQKIVANPRIKKDWTKQQVSEIYHSPLMDLIHSAATVHRKFHDASEVQLCTLMNIKTGGCTEDCKYCAQSSRYDTGVEAEKVVKIDEVLKEAELAVQNGSTRFCMGAAWREMKGRKRGLKNIAEMVKKVNDMGLETCVTLGMIDAEQMQELADAGLTAYNHNIDTSREHYPKVITTRSYDERLQTIENVRQSGVGVCTGGILGLGETQDDHIGFLYTLCTMREHPESLPINRLVPIKGTPLGDELLAAGKEKQQSLEEILRTIAAGRILMPRSIIRLAAGRYTMKEPEQMMCFMAGVNAIFTGKKMLTTMCNGWDEDKQMLEKWGLKPMKSFRRSPMPLQQKQLSLEY